LNLMIDAPVVDQSVRPAVRQATVRARTAGRFMIKALVPFLALMGAATRSFCRRRDGDGR